MNNVLLPNDTNNVLNTNLGGIYTVEVKSLNGCVDTSSQTTIGIYNVPSAEISFTGDSSICFGDYITLNGPTDTGLSYYWYQNDTLQINDTLQSISIGQQANYKLKIETQFGCQNESAPVNISVNPLPFASLAVSGNTTFCNGDSVVLQTIQDTNYSYLWFLNSQALNGDTLNNLTVSTMGNYKVKVSNQYNCSIFSSDTSIIVNQVPISDFIIDTIANQKDTITIAYNGIVSASASFVWNNSNANIISTTNSMLELSWDTIGNKNISLIVSDSGCTSALTTKNILILPSSSFAVSTDSMCINNQASIIYNGYSDTLATYNWNFDGGQIINGSGQGSYIVEWQNSGIKNISLSIVDNGISSVIETKTIKVNPLPSFSLPINNTVCLNSSINISPNITSNDSPYSYLWSTGQVSNSISITPLFDSTIFLTITNKFGCESYDTSFITVNKPFANENICFVTVDSSTNHTKIVWNSTSNVHTDYTNIYRESSTSGNWNLIGSTSFNNASEFIDTSSNTDVNSYNYSLSIVDSCGNESLKSSTHKSMLLAVNAGVNINDWNLTWNTYEGFQANTYYIYRADSNMNFVLVDSVANTSSTNYLWADNSPLGMYYYIAAANPNDSCSYISSINPISNIVLNGIPGSLSLIPEFSADTMFGFYPLTVMFEDETTNGTVDTWLWDFGDGDTSNIENPTHIYDSLGIYTVSLTVTNAYGSETLIKTDYIEVLFDDIVEIDVEMSTKLYPNPNNGNFTIEINDKGLHNMWVHVYNALGSEVYSEKFQTNGNTHKKLNFSTMPNGVYFVHLNTNEKIVYRTKVIIQK